MLTVINCYLPCRGNKGSDEHFKSVIDEVRELIIKYKVTSEIVLLGDLNASLHRNPALTRDLYMNVILIDLSLPERYPTVYTYQHGNGKSVIDYILHSKTGTVSDVKIMTDNHLNILPHAPVAAYIPHIQRLVIIKMNLSREIV